MMFQHDIFPLGNGCHWNIPLEQIYSERNQLGSWLCPNPKPQKSSSPCDRKLKALTDQSAALPQLWWHLSKWSRISGFSADEPRLCQLLGKQLWAWVSLSIIKTQFHNLSICSEMENSMTTQLQQRKIPSLFLCHRHGDVKISVDKDVKYTLSCAGSITGEISYLLQVIFQPR